MIVRLLGPSFVIATFFFLFWSVKYPTELWEGAFFQAGHGAKETFIFIVIWMWLAMTVMTVTWIVHRFI
jgi:hypothetical protein